MSFFLGALAESATRVYQAFSWGFTLQDLDEETDFVTKVANRECWRAGCKQPEAAGVGLCAEHIREMRGW